MYSSDAVLRVYGHSLASVIQVPQSFGMSLVQLLLNAPSTSIFRISLASYVK